MVERAQIARGATHVTVACKLPNGLILQLWEMRDRPVASPTGTKMEKHAVKKGEPIKLAGSVLHFGRIPEYPMPGGYSLTQVPVDFWEEWCRQNADADVLANKIIFACDTPDKAADQAREQHRAKIKSGFEPIDPKKPPAVGAIKVTTAVTA